MGGLELLDPKGLWLLAGLAPLIVFYILKIKRTRIVLPSTWLWQSAKRDLLAKAPIKRLVAQLPLILQILALIALAIALARPTVGGKTIDGQHVAIVIDTSASMGTTAHDAKGATASGLATPGASPGLATPGASTRMDEAKRAATDVVSQLAPGADAFVVEAARDARLVAPLDRDERRLKAAIATLAVRDVEGDLSSAIALAADRLRSLGGRTRIVLVTDGALAHDAPLAAAGIPTEIITVGDAEDNAAIVRIDIRSGVDVGTAPRSASDPSLRSGVRTREQVQVFAMVRNYATRPRDAYVTLSFEGKGDTVASRRVLVGPNDKAPVVLTFEPKADDHGKGLVVQLSPGDAMPGDDAAYGRVPAGMRMPVAIASNAPYSWTTRALEADPDVDLQRISVGQLATVNIDPESFVVVEGACPASMPGDDLLVIDPPQGTCFGVEVGAPVDTPPITSWEAGDARLRFLTLDGVHVSKSATLRAPGANGALVRSTSTALIADASSPGRMVTVVGFDVGESDWPLKASFVLFMRNVVELARLHRAQGAAGPARTGEALRVAVPGATTSVRVEGPGMPEHDATAKDGFVIVPAVERAGIYHVRWTSPHIGEALVAANLTSEKESDVRPRTVVVDGAAGATATTTRAAKIADAHSEGSTWLALLAALVIAFDVWWLTRKPRASQISTATVTGGTS
jgi:hypothetical protein